MGIKKIESKTLRQEIYEILKEEIASAEVLPGERISLRGLSERFGVSLSPVREALLQLESERIVVIENNKSIRVKNLSWEEMEEILRIRISFDQLAAKRACDYRPDSLLPEIEGILRAMWKTFDQPFNYLKLHKNFHFAIYHAGNSPILVDIIAGLWARIGPYIYLHVKEKGDIPIAMEYHQEMFDALVERDKEKISNAIQKDFQTGAHRIKEFMYSLDWDISNYRFNEMLKKEGGQQKSK